MYSTIVIKVAKAEQTEVEETVSFTYASWLNNTTDGCQGLL